jgi:hypothetical protein
MLSVDLCDPSVISVTVLKKVTQRTQSITEIHKGFTTGNEVGDLHYYFLQIITACLQKIFRTKRVMSVICFSLKIKFTES